jgi:hypothetical protein
MYASKKDTQKVENNSCLKKEKNQAGEVVSGKMKTF